MTLGGEGIALYMQAGGGADKNHLPRFGSFCALTGSI